ncbi:NF-kappa-B inhibitor epsilon isoform 2-T2 [Dugong dugon]
MSEARKGPDEADESQYDSGIESLRSLRSLPESTPASGPSDSGSPQPWTQPRGNAKEPHEKEDADGERADSTYGSSSLIEPLPLLGGAEAEDPAPGSPLPPAGALSPQQLEALTYISEEGDTLVHLAVIHEAPAVLLCCLALLPQDVLDIQNNLYQTALHLAVHLDQPGAVRALVLKGASRVLQDRHGDTALHVACQRQHLDCARCLLEGRPEPGRGPPHSLDLQLQNWQGLACLHIATLQRNRPLMELLLQNGADIDIQAPAGRLRCTWLWKPRSGAWYSSCSRLVPGWMPVCSTGALPCTSQLAGASAASHPPCVRQELTRCFGMWRMRHPRTWLRIPLLFCPSMT